MINEILSEALLPLMVVGIIYLMSRKPLGKSDKAINEVPNPYYKGKA
jgi:hypothetical protein